MKKEPVTKDGFVKIWDTKGKARHSFPSRLERSRQSNYFRLNWKGLSPRVLGVCDGPVVLRMVGGTASPHSPAAIPRAGPDCSGGGCKSQRWPQLQLHKRQLTGHQSQHRATPRSVEVNH